MNHAGPAAVTETKPAMGVCIERQELPGSALGAVDERMPILVDVEKFMSDSGMGLFEPTPHH
jgi:hypothetical protein